MAEAGVEGLLARLRGVQGKGPRWRALCPAHESKHGTRTLAIFEVERDRILLRCHAGCDVGAIVAAIGMELTDLFPPRAQDDQRPFKALKNPWSEREAIRALAHELMVGWVILGDVAAGRPLTASARKRASKAQERALALIEELG